MEDINKNKKKTDSLKKRYFFKLGAGFIHIPISLITAAIVPRSLGPSAYGNFTFLTQFFEKVVGFFESASSLCFYNKLSQRLHEKGLIKFYWFFVLIISILIMIFLPIVFFFNKQKILWPDQSIIYIWMALFFSLLSWCSKVVVKIVDAYGYTAKGEIVKTIQRIVGLILILILFFAGNLNLTTIFLYHYIITFLFIIASGYFLEKNGVSLFPKVKLNLLKIKNYIIEFWKYSHPIIVISWIALLVGVLEIWLLQKFAGSVQQGYYGLAFKISKICLLFSGSLYPLLMREFSISFGKKDMDKMRKLFTRYIPIIYVAVSFLVIFISINSGKIVFLFAGKKFLHAKIPVAIMVLFPIHQSYGQLCGSLFYATEKTQLLRNVSVISLLLSLPLIYILLAPTSLFGLNMGAMGLAIKMVSVQFITVNVLMYYSSQFLKISFLKYFSHQIYTIATFGIIAYLSLFIASIFTDRIIISFFINGIIYVILSICLLFSFPKIFLLSRKELNKYVDLVKTKISYINK